MTISGMCLTSRLDLSSQLEAVLTLNLFPRSSHPHSYRVVAITLTPPHPLNKGPDMKLSIFLLMLYVLTGCVLHNVTLPPVSGEPQPVNTPAIIQELTSHV